jgi:hypothetical protein
VKGDAYIPVYNEDLDSWYPCNRGAELLVHLSHIWKDIQTLNNLRLKQPSEDKIADKLLFKHIIIEFISLLDSLREIQGVVMKSPRLIKGQSAPWRYITKREFLEAKKLFKELGLKLKPVEKELRDIRNQIGAHRELSDLFSVRHLWEKLDATKYVDAMNVFPPLFKFLQELNIYEWSCSGGEHNGMIAISTFGTLLVTPWEEAFDSENETI